MTVSSSFKIREKASTPGWREEIAKSWLFPEIGSVATFDFAEKPLAFRDFAERPVVDVEALRQGGLAVFQANPGFFGRIKSLQHLPEIGRK